MKEYKELRMMNEAKTEEGFIALTSVLIIGAVIIILGVSIFYASLTDQAISNDYQNGQKSNFLADFCLKEGILRLKENIDYMGAEDIKVDDATCSVSLVENVDDNTKKVSSLGRAGEQPHFSRSAQLIRFVMESKRSDWEQGESESLEITEEGSLKLKQSGDIVLLNEASGVSCGSRCQQENGYLCKSVGTDSETANDGSGLEAIFNTEDGKYYCEKVITGNWDCGTVMVNYREELPDGCDGYFPDWTYCRCGQGGTTGYRTSPEFDISGPYTVKDSQIFWQADERFNGTIKVEVRISYDGGSNWSDWEQAVNGTSITGLEPGIDLSAAKIQTKTSFVGGPDFYPTLENIKIFIDLE